MSALDRIGVRIESSPVGLGGGIGALAFEIAGMLERLAAGGECGSIDLRSLPMTAEDRCRLQEVLGTGEVLVTLDADGKSNIRETAIHGVWWSEYRDARGDLLAEIIEICRIPDILLPETAQLRSGAQRLRQRLTSLAAVTAGAS